MNLSNVSNIMEGLKYGPNGKIENVRTIEQQSKNTKKKDIVQINIRQQCPGLIVDNYLRRYW